MFIWGKEKKTQIAAIFEELPDAQMVEKHHDKPKGCDSVYTILLFNSAKTAWYKCGNKSWTVAIVSKVYCMPIYHMCEMGFDVIYFFKTITLVIIIVIISAIESVLRIMDFF